ncbi:MAG: hypothetical protein IKC48_04600 [Clostridia bacterium]|nr:hypothetical protein [Clostridia bacterium]
MTKEKVKRIVKRLSYILEMMRDGKTECVVYISKAKEKIVVDDDVLLVIEIMDEIIENEQTEWRKKFFVGIRKGFNDIYIIHNCPMERTKYYAAKKAFVDKIYECCIYRGLVDYKDILNTIVG